MGSELLPLVSNMPKVNKKERGNVPNLCFPQQIQSPGDRKKYRLAEKGGVPSCLNGHIWAIHFVNEGPFLTDWLVHAYEPQAFFFLQLCFFLFFPILFLLLLVNILLYHFLLLFTVWQLSLPTSLGLPPLKTSNSPVFSTCFPPS